MKHLIYTSTPQPDYPICILTNHISADEIAKAYLHPIKVDTSMVLVLGLHQKVGAKKTPVKEIKEFITSELVDVLNDNGVQYVVCTDAEYFKQLTGVTKADPHIGYVMDNKFGSWKVVYAPSHRTIFHSPEPTKAKILQAMEAIKAHAEGSYQEPGSQMLQNVFYPKTYFEIQSALAELLAMDVPLAIDIETFNLKHYSAGIGSICFALNEHDGVAFAVDYQPLSEPSQDGFYGQQVRNEPVRQLLKQFFQQYSNKSLYHNISFDATVLIYQLFMEHILDSEGLHAGMEAMLRNWDCTKLITYLATNSCAGNELGLKAQAQEHAGNYAVDEIKDIRKIPLDTLLRYNLADGCSTWFAFNKNYPVMVADDQEKVYQYPFRPALLDIIQMQLTGMPVNMETVKTAKAKLQADNDDAVRRIAASQYVQEYQHLRKEKWVEEKNITLKKKRVTLADAEEEMKKVKSDVRWNPNSNPQMQEVLYGLIGLPVIERTDSDSPATDGDTLKALKNHTTDQRVIDLLDAFLDYAAVNKILTSFIPALENAQRGPDGWHYLFGNFNLGGTVSGRLSSNNPNLQNLPATGSKYAKTIKECFEAPPGWLFIGLDFNALEARVDALVTRDQAKLLVYTKGYDSHAYACYHYWPEKFPDVVLSTEEKPFRTFVVVSSGQTHYLKEGDEVELPDGSIKRIEDIC